MFKKAPKRLLSMLLAWLLVFGVLPVTSFGAELGNLTEAEYDSEDRLARKVDLGALDESSLANGKQGIDLRSDFGQSINSLQNDISEETEYIKGVAEELTEPIGIIGLDGYGPNDQVYVLVWLQELPDALARVYASQGINTASYSQAASSARSARSAIRAMGTSGGGSAAPARGQEVKIEYEYFEVFAGFAIKAAKSKIDEIAAMSGVYAVTEVSFYTMDDYDTYTRDPEYTVSGNGAAREVMEVDDLHAANIDGRDVKVGVIDSGIDATHPDLIDAYKGGYNYADKTADMTKPDGYHGTHVAGTIASQGDRSLGIAPGVDLYMAQVFTVTRPNSASEADTTAAIEAFAKGDASKGIPKVDIINMSMGNTLNSAYYSDRYTRNNAVIAGVMLVCSGGNNAFPENNTTDRRNYTLGSGGVSLPLSVAAAKYGGDALLGYNMTATNEQDGSETITLIAENYDASISGLFKNGRFGFTDVHSVTFDAANSSNENNVWIDPPYYGTYERQPLNYVEGKGYELYYACSTTADMTADEMAALQALPKDSLVGKILVVNRGQSFSTYLGEALRLGAGAVIVLNRDESYIGSMVIAYALAEDMAVFSGGVSNRQKLLSVLAAGEKAYLNPGNILKQHLEFEPADFSSIGPVNETAQIKPDVIAPGWSIISTALDGGYISISGTSMASPWVAGLAALVKQQYPDATPAEIKARIMNTANPDLIKPLSSRLSSPNYYFDANGAEISVFEQGAGFIDPKRAVYEDIYITVLDNDVPTGNTDKSVMTAQMGSFSFGPTIQGSESKKLTATVNGGTLEGIEVVYNQDTRYSNKNLSKAVEVFYEINGSSFDVWLTIAENANADAKSGGNLYEGYIIATVDGKEYVLPWATRVGEFKEAESDFWLVYPDRPVQATYGHVNQDWASYSSQNYIYFMFEGKAIADSVALTVSGNAITGYTYTMYVYLISAPSPALKYRYGITIATGQKSSAMKLSDFITIGDTYYANFNGRAYALNAQGTAWQTTLSNVAAGSYNLAPLIGTNYTWKTWSGITFSNTRPTLTVEGFTFDASYYTNHEVAYAADEVTVDGRIYSAGLAEAANNGFMWAGLYAMLKGEIYSLDQSYNVLVDASTGLECKYNNIVGPYICDSAGNFSLTFLVQADGYFFPEDFSASGAVYATDAFDTSLILYSGEYYTIPFGSLASYQWCPKIVKAAPEIMVISTELANGELRVQFKLQDGTNPEALDPDKLTATLFKNGEFDQNLTVFEYDPETGIAIWTFEPYKVKSFEPLIITATVTYNEYYITTDVDSNEANSIYITDVIAEASVKKLNGDKNDLTIIVTELYSDGSTETFTQTFSIDNNAAGTYAVDVYSVYVDTKGNDQIRNCYVMK